MELARANGIPVFGSAEAALGCVDLACLALPPAPAEALDLLRAGVPVLCEHPQTVGFLEAAGTAAREGGTVFRLNAHFSRLPASAAFIAQGRLRQLQAEPRFAMVTATDRSMFAAVDILAGVLGTPGQTQGRKKFVPGLTQVTQSDDLRHRAFVTLGSAWNGVEVWWQIQGRGPGDGSAEYLVDYRVALGFPDGLLTLLSLAGPVIWNANYARFGDSGQTLFTVVQASAENLSEQRARANLAAIDSLYEDTPANQTREYLAGVAGLWEDLGRRL